MSRKMSGSQNFAEAVPALGVTPASMIFGVAVLGFLFYVNGSEAGGGTWQDRFRGWPSLLILLLSTVAIAYLEGQVGTR